MNGTVNDGPGLALAVGLAAGVLLIAKGKGHRFQKQKNVILNALFVDLLDEVELMLGISISVGSY